MSKDKNDDKDMINDKAKANQKDLVQKAIKLGMKENDELLRKLSKN